MGGTAAGAGAGTKAGEYLLVVSLVERPWWRVLQAVFRRCSPPCP